jgi:hypothetical protein
MEIPGAMAYGQTREESIESARALALRVTAETLN